MNTHSDKTQENKNQVIVNDPTQKSTGGTSTFQFADNRSETIVQRKLHNLANHNLQTQMRSKAGITSENVVQKQGTEEEELLQGKFNPVQMKAPEEEELLQGKFEPIQKMGIEEEEPLQGKFNPVQKKAPEEEELLQGKFEPIQKMGIEEEEPLQGKFNPVQMKASEEEELLQGKFKPIQKKAGPEPSRRENNTGLPDNLKSGIENMSGYSMDDVKVNYNSNMPGQLNAHAYAQGTDIHVAPGQEKHLPHEAWHVVQQKQGRVKPTMQMKGNINVNDDAGLEKEADEMGAKALQRKLEDSEISMVKNSVTQKKSKVVQRVGIADNSHGIITQRKPSEQAIANNHPKLSSPGKNVTTQRVQAHDEANENGDIPSFELGADIDCTKQLVVRGDGFGYGASAKQLGEHNKGIEQKGPKKSPKWPSGISAFESVNSSPLALPKGKKACIVKSLPPELKITQVGKPEHAEIHTAQDLSTAEIGAAIKKIVLTDMYDGEVAQL